MDESVYVVGIDVSKKKLDVALLWRGKIKSKVVENTPQGYVRRFSSAKALAAFIGVSPRQRLSGTSLKGRTMLSRTGHASLRHALYMPGLVARQHNPALRYFGDRLRANGLAPKAVVGAVMRKLTHLIYGVITSGAPFDATRAMPKLDFQDGI